MSASDDITDGQVAEEKIHGLMKVFVNDNDNQNTHIQNNNNNVGDQEHEKDGVHESLCDL